MTVMPIIFGRSLSLGYAKAKLYLGTNHQYEIAEYDTLARLRRLIRLERAAEPVTADHIARAESSRLANARSDAARATARALMDQMEYPSTMPFYNTLLVDSQGNLWVRRYAYFAEISTWDVFDPAGRLLGAVPMPRGFWPNVITNRELLGRSRDEFGVERLQKFRLIKPGESEIGQAVISEPNRASETTPIAYRRCGT
jgi:hypothetical protein